jgi:ABC-type transport system involved in multi-copper enzyme maturation permease subunit
VRTLLVILRSHRFEFAGFLVIVFATFIVAGGLVIRLSAAGIPTACFNAGPEVGGLCQGRTADIRSYFEAAGTWGWASLAAIVLLPVVSGLILGVALVGKEIDRGTTTFAWSIGPSRRRWLLQRVVPVAIAVVMASLVAGALADRLEVLRNPTSPAATFEHLGTRGIVVGGEALAFFGIGLLVGAAIGRMLPALLMAGALAIGAYGLVTVATDAFLSSETVLINGVDGVVPDRVVDYLVRTPDGSVLTWMEANVKYGDLSQVDAPDGSFTTVLRVNPIAMYPLVVDRMTLLYSGLGLASIVIAFAVVDRRRP